MFNLFMFNLLRFTIYVLPFCILCYTIYLLPFTIFLYLLPSFLTFNLFFLLPDTCTSHLFLIQTWPVPALLAHRKEIWFKPLKKGWIQHTSKINLVFSENFQWNLRSRWNFSCRPQVSMMVQQKKNFEEKQIEVRLSIVDPPTKPSKQKKNR